MHIKDKIRLHLSVEFSQRVERNKKYSLRAFAKFLEVDPSLLSKIFNQKRQMSDETAKQFLMKLPSSALCEEFNSYYEG